MPLQFGTPLYFLKCQEEPHLLFCIKLWVARISTGEYQNGSKRRGKLLQKKALFLPHPPWWNCKTDPWCLTEDKLWHGPFSDAPISECCHHMRYLILLQTVAYWWRHMLKKFISNFIWLCMNSRGLWKTLKMNNKNQGSRSHVLNLITYGSNHKNLGHIYTW